MSYDDGHIATEAEAHLEWHINAGVPVGEPCPWDACAPDAGYDEYRQALEADQPKGDTND